MSFRHLPSLEGFYSIIKNNTEKCFNINSVGILGMFNVSLPLSYFRNVEPELKSLAMGFHSLTIRTLGMINM